MAPLVLVYRLTSIMIRFPPLGSPYSGIPLSVVSSEDGIENGTNKFEYDYAGVSVEEKFSLPAYNDV